MKKLKSFAIAALVLLSGCISNNSYLSQRSLILKNRVFSEGKSELKQETNAVREIRFGVVADIHNEAAKAEKIAKEFESREVCGIIVAGDISRHFSDSKKVPEEKEIRDSLIPFLETKKPVYVIAGNHETKNVYFKTLDSLAERYDNLFDLATLKYIDLNGVNIFGVSGGTTIPSGGFSVRKEAREIDNKVFSLDNDPVLMISHMPPKFNHPGAIDCIYDVLAGRKTIRDRHRGEEMLYEGKGIRANPRNKGLKELTDLLKNRVDFSVSGHYHMNQGANNLETNVPENTYSEKLFTNPGACQYDSAAIITIKGNSAKYELLKIN
jgi:Icc-related predicted phosphoesterase